MGLKKYLTILIAVAFIGGCAAMTRGTNEPIEFKSSPQSAKVELSDGQSCDATPCSISLPRTVDVSATFKLEGCDDLITNIRGKSSDTGAWMVAGNIMFGATIQFIFATLWPQINESYPGIVGGISGLIVDLWTGAGYDAHPNPVEVELNCD